MDVPKKGPSLNDVQRRSLNKNKDIEAELPVAKKSPRQHEIIFPDGKGARDTVSSTIPNLQALLAHENILVRYDMMKKAIDVRLPGHVGTQDNASEVALAHIMSLAASHGMGTANIPAYLEAIADKNAYHPAADWIRSRPWDGQDRLQAMCDTIEVVDDYPLSLRDVLIRKWLLSSVAAVLKPHGFHARGVLTLQGKQGIGKTSWVRSLIDDPHLRSAAIKVDHHLDPHNKDSVLNAVRHWYVEIGEIDSVFKRDVARLKGFITADSDKVRKPYSRRESEYPRRTVFVATVNEHAFLVDPTGNTRFWTIRVSKIDYNHGIDMQQVFAQLAVEFEAGEQWWLDPAMEQALEEENRRHQMASVVEDMLAEAIDDDFTDGEQHLPAFTATELLIRIGIERPTNAQAREAGTILRNLFGSPKRIKGREKWRVPLRDEANSSRHEPVSERPRKKVRFD